MSIYNYLFNKCSSSAFQVPNIVLTAGDIDKNPSSTKVCNSGGEVRY